MRFVSSKNHRCLLKRWLVFRVFFVSLVLLVTLVPFLLWPAAVDTVPVKHQSAVTMNTHSHGRNDHPKAEHNLPLWMQYGVNDHNPTGVNLSEHDIFQTIDSLNPDQLYIPPSQRDIVAEISQFLRLFEQNNNSLDDFSELLEYPHSRFGMNKVKLKSYLTRCLQLKNNSDVPERYAEFIDDNDDGVGSEEECGFVRSPNPSNVSHTRFPLYDYPVLFQWFHRSQSQQFKNADNQSSMKKKKNSNDVNNYGNDSHFMREPRPRRIRNVCMVTQLSIERIKRMQTGMCQTWSGPISLSVFIRKNHFDHLVYHNDSTEKSQRRSQFRRQSRRRRRRRRMTVISNDDSMNDSDSKSGFFLGLSDSVYASSSAQSRGRLYVPNREGRWKRRSKDLAEWLAHQRSKHFQTVLNNLKSLLKECNQIISLSLMFEYPMFGAGSLIASKETYSFMNDWYPVNHLRNLALEQITNDECPYVFLLDSDFIPNHGMYQQLISNRYQRQIFLKPRLKQNKPSILYVIPAFESTDSSKIDLAFRTPILMNSSEMAIQDRTDTNNRDHTTISPSSLTSRIRPYWSLISPAFIHLIRSSQSLSNDGVTQSSSKKMKMKKDMLNLDHYITQFHSASCPLCHRYTQYSIWMGGDKKGISDKLWYEHRIQSKKKRMISRENGSKIQYIRVNSSEWLSMYEPYFIIQRQGLHRFDERFRGYGYNKIVHFKFLHRCDQIKVRMMYHLGVGHVSHGPSLSSREFHDLSRPLRLFISKLSRQVFAEMQYPCVDTVGYFK